MAECFVLQAWVEGGIERAQARGVAGVGGLAIGGEALPDLIAITAQGVEGHGDIGEVLLSLAHQLPVVAEARDEADIVFHPAVGDVAGFDHVDDGEQHQRLVRGEAAFRGAGYVEVGELAEPEAAVWLRHGESKWLVRSVQ